VTENYFVASPGILGIRTNLKDFKWSYGTIAPRVTQQDYNECLVRLVVKLEKDLHTPTNNLLGKYHYFSGVPNGDVIYYSRPFMFGAKLKYKVEGLLGTEPVVTFNKNYLRFVTHRFMNVHSAGFTLTDLASLLLIQRGYTPVHCSAFEYQGSTIVVVAPPNTGKTLTTMMALKDHNARFLSEDLAITDGRTIHSVPWTSTFRFYNKIDKSWRSKLGGILQGAFPPIELLPLRNQHPITRFIPAQRILSRATASHLVILERGNKAVEEIGVNEAWQKVRNLNRYEFNYARAPAAIAYEFFNPKVGIEAANQRENELLGSLVRNVHKRIIVRSNSPTDYTDLVLDALQRHCKADPHETIAA